MSEDRLQAIVRELALPDIKLQYILGMLQDKKVPDGFVAQHKQHVYNLICEAVRIFLKERGMK